MVLSRRQALLGAAFTGCFPIRAARAQSGADFLAQLRASKVARIGIANQPPFSGMDPTGKLAGLTPLVAQAVMERLGVPKLQATVATYGELVPGLMAGRWDFIGAALNVTKERCTRVLFSDPVLFDGGSLVMLKGALSEPPRLVAEVGKRNLMLGVQGGGAHARMLPELGVPAANILQFTSDTSIIDALVAKRIQVAFGSSSGLKNAYRQRGLAVDVVFPVADDPAHASANAFRPGDTELQAAFNRELQA